MTQNFPFEIDFVLLPPLVAVQLLQLEGPLQTLLERVRERPSEVSRFVTFPVEFLGPS